MTFVLFVHRQQRKTIMDPYERLVAINEALQEAMKPNTATIMGADPKDPSMRKRLKMGEKQHADTKMMGAMKTMATNQDMTYNPIGQLRDMTASGRAYSAKKVAATAIQSEVGDTARALKKRGGIIGGTKTGRRLAIVGRRVASRLGLTPKADKAAKKLALNRRINKRGEIRKDIGYDFYRPTSELGF